MLRRGVITQSVCKNVTLYLNQAGLSPASSAQTPADPLPTKPLLLMLPWLGSRPHAVAKYCETYFRLGFDVLMVQSNMLVHVSQNPEKYEAFPGRIKGHVYDSAVVGSVEKMAKGLGITVFPHCEKLVTKASLLYFSAFKRQTVDHFNRGIEVFKSTPVRAPVLFFFCENDPLSDHLAVEEVLDLWRKRGMDVTGKSWEDSTHAGHLRRHPQEYQLVLDNFLYSLKLSALQSRM
ncbi:uncharacterized protein si:dkey-5i3.5 isoform X4 [Gadus morhua]|uniref:uncharacterized protein si:dkey-5i3.5 isoform X4 n=1 Tax=Gadus morhua TaxID=8049 RepID=UPI0011B5A208|nr:uncharacterized protein LOC115550446 isoform X4 [Gadus morhua]